MCNHHKTEGPVHYTASLLVPSIKDGEFVSARDAIDLAEELAKMNGMTIVHKDSVDQILPNQLHDGAWRVSMHVYDSPKTQAGEQRAKSFTTKNYRDPEDQF